jgi:hypothetical protein
MIGLKGQKSEMFLAHSILSRIKKDLLFFFMLRQYFLRQGKILAHVAH